MNSSYKTYISNRHEVFVESHDNRTILPFGPNSVDAIHAIADAYREYDEPKYSEIEILVNIETES